MEDANLRVDGLFRRAIAAAEIAHVLVDFEASENLDVIELELVLFRRLREAYGEAATPDVLRSIAAEYREFRDQHEIDLLKSELCAIIQLGATRSATAPSLGADCTVVRPSPSPAPPRICVADGDPAQTTACVEAELTDSFASVRKGGLELEEAQRDVRSALRPAFSRLRLLHRITLDRENRAVGSILVGSSNALVTITVREKDTFVLPDVESLTEISIGRVDFATPVAGEDVDEDGGDEGSDDGGFVLGDTMTVEVHRRYRINLGLGLTFSGRKGDEYSLEDTDAGPILGHVPGETSTDIVLWFNYYLNPLDLYPGKGGAAFGPAIGVAIDAPTEQLYVGGFVQPFVGVQLLAGVNVGREQQRRDQPLAAAATLDDFVHRPYTTNLFISVGLDAGIFRKLFGGG